MLWITKWY